MSTKGHEGPRRGTKGLAGIREGSAEGRERGPRRATKEKKKEKTRTYPRSHLQNSDLHLASHGFPPGSAGVPIDGVVQDPETGVSPWERGRPARILVKALSRRQSAGEPTNPVKPIATTLPGLVRAGRPRSQGSQPFPAKNPTYWRILQKARISMPSRYRYLLHPSPHKFVVGPHTATTLDGSTAKCHNNMIR